MLSVVGQRITWAIVIALLVLVAVTAYRNVFADDSAVRTRAEKLGRETAGCANDCKVTRLEGSRGMLSETLTYTFQSGATVVVKCRRAYIAFGDYACEAARR
jgi:hypothetical protein